MRRSTIWGSSLAVAALAASSLLVVPSADASPAAPAGPSVIATGFAGPLHVAFGDDDTLYVADAFAGVLTRVDLESGRSRVLAAGLGFSPGVDVTDHGRVLVAASDQGGPGPQSPTHLLSVTRRGTVSQKADLLAYELAHNPDGQSLIAPDAQSNPYSVLVARGRTYVADAGANDILEVRADGSIRTVVALPVITSGACEGRPNNDPEHAGCDAVPTDLELGDDGSLYISGLGAEVEGHIYRVNPRTGAIIATWGQLPPLTGVAVGHDGTIYAASLFTNQVFRLRHGVMSVADVPAPTDVELSHGLLVAASLTGNVFSIPAAAFH